MMFRNYFLEMPSATSAASVADAFSEQWLAVRPRLMAGVAKLEERWNAGGQIADEAERGRHCDKIGAFESAESMVVMANAFRLKAEREHGPLDVEVENEAKDDRR